MPSYDGRSANELNGDLGSANYQKFGPIEGPFGAMLTVRQLLYGRMAPSSPSVGSSAPSQGAATSNSSGTSLLDLILGE